MASMKSAKTIAAAYQLASDLLLGGNALSKGQRRRLGNLLLDVLSEPDRYSAKTIRRLRRLATMP
jgi:hypothetical protein